MAAVLARDCIKYWKWPSIDISSISDTLKKSEIYLPFNMLMSQEPVGKYIRRKQHITSLSPSVHYFFFAWIAVYTVISCVCTEVMLPLLVHSAVGSVYMLIQQNMCLVHPLLATFGNISLVCGELILQFLLRCTGFASLFCRHIWLCEGGSPEPARGDRGCTATRLPGRRYQPMAICYLASEQLMALSYHSSEPACYQAVWPSQIKEHNSLKFLWKRRQAV